MINTRFITSLLISTAFLTSIFIILCVEGELPWDVLQPDTASYVTLASSLSQNHFYSLDGITPSAIREPLYPMFLASFIKLEVIKPYSSEQANFLPVIAVQVVLYVFILIMLARFSRFSEWKTAVPLTIVFGGLYLPISQYVFQVLSELPAMLLAVSFIITLVSWEEQGEHLRLLFAGLLLGMLAIIKSVVIPFGFLCGLFLFVSRKATLWLVGAFIGISLLLPLVWGLRNYMQFDKVIVGTTDGASSLYRGNFLFGQQVPSLNDPRIPREVMEAVKRSPETADSFLSRRVRERFLNQPVEYVANLFYKGYVLLFGLPTTKLHCFIMFSKLIFMGLIASRGRHYWKTCSTAGRIVFLFAGYLFCSYTFIYVTPRYFAPAMLLLLPFAVDAGLHWGGKIKKGASS